MSAIIHRLEALERTIALDIGAVLRRLELIEQNLDIQHKLPLLEQMEAVIRRLERLERVVAALLGREDLPPVPPLASEAAAPDTERQVQVVGVDDVPPDAGVLVNDDGQYLRYKSVDRSKYRDP